MTFSTAQLDEGARPSLRCWRGRHSEPTLKRQHSVEQLRRDLRCPAVRLLQTRRLSGGAVVVSDVRGSQSHLACECTRGLVANGDCAGLPAEASLGGLLLCTIG